MLLRSPSAKECFCRSTYDKAGVGERKRGCGCRNDATKMHRENGNLIAVKWTEGKMVAAIMRQKGKMERFIRLTIDKILFYWTKKCLNVCICQKKAVNLQPI